MGLLQAQLLTFNSSLPVTPYRIASWKILVERQEQRKDVRLLLKGTGSQGRGSPLVAGVGGSARGTWAPLKTGGKSGDIHQTGEQRKGQCSGGGSFASLCSVSALSGDEVCVSGWKKFLCKHCVHLLNCHHGPPRVHSAHQARGCNNAHKLQSSHR